MEDSHTYCPYDGLAYKPSDKECIRCGNKRYIKPTKWKKVLYEKQPFPDSYVSENFLASLITREHGSKYDYSHLVDSTTEITHVLNSLVLFLIVFYYCWNLQLSEEILIRIDSFLLLSGYILYAFIKRDTKQLLHTAKTGVLLLGSLFNLCPVLQTINKTYANDTIGLLFLIFLFFHLILYDYSFVQQDENSNRRTPGVTSINSGLISALMASSRLQGVYYVFGILSLAFMVFGFLPYLRRLIHNYSYEVYKISVFLLTFVNSLIMFKISGILSSMILLSFIFIRYLCPLWLISMHSYKNEIEGPWDLPNVKNHTFL